MMPLFISWVCTCILFSVIRLGGHEIRGCKAQEVDLGAALSTSVVLGNLICQ